MSGCCRVVECSRARDMCHRDNMPAAHAVWHFPAGCTRRRPCSDVLHFLYLFLHFQSGVVHQLFTHFVLLLLGFFSLLKQIPSLLCCYQPHGNEIKQELKFSDSKYNPCSLVVVCLTSGNGIIAGSAKLERE